jgi:hypothetical protein
MSVITILFVAGALIVAVGLTPFWLDRVAVWTMRTFHIPAFPHATRLAFSLERDTAEWRFTESQAEHQTIGSIRLAAGCHGLYVLVRSANDLLGWEPNFIEQRIIWDAATNARARVIRAQLEKVLPT